MEISSTDRWVAFSGPQEPTYAKQLADQHHIFKHKHESPSIKHARLKAKKKAEMYAMTLVTSVNAGETPTPQLRARPVLGLHRLTMRHTDHC
jgi:hypothetical protein